MTIKSGLRFAFLLILLPTFFSIADAQKSVAASTRTRTFDVQHYIIRTSFDRAKKMIFGDTIVQLKPLHDNFGEIELDAVKLKFDSVRLETENKDLEYRTSDDKIFIKLDKKYSPRDLIAVRLMYSAKPKKGVYFVAEEKENGKILHSAQVWTQGEAEESRYWFPSYDFPDDKATSEQFITIDADETAIANGELVETTQNADGTKTVHYQMSVPYSNYLTSFVVGKYVKIEDQYKNIPIGVYIYPGKEDVAKKFALTGQMIGVFEQLTGVAFPYNKYDQTIVGKFNFGGMENITATTMSDIEIFNTMPNNIEDLISHELAHSWFGDLVTCKNWSELWLNEGFAEYMESAYREKIYGHDEYVRKNRAEAEEFFVDEAKNEKRHSLFYQAARGSDDSIFDTTTYQKGSVVVYMLRETVGAENFWKAINIYLNRHKLGNVETADLQKVMEKVSDKNLDWFFDQWVYAAGYPQLNVKQVYNPQSKNLTLTISQTQKKDKITPEAFRLPLEVEISTASGTKSEKLTIKKREEIFTFKTDGEPIYIAIDKDEKIPLKSVKIEALEMANAK